MDVLSNWQSLTTLSFQLSNSTLLSNERRNGAVQQRHSQTDVCVTQLAFHPKSPHPLKAEGALEGLSVQESILDFSTLFDLLVPC